MAKNTVLILHGWSDTAESLQHLKQILHANGYPTASVYLGSYESMEDHVTFDNLAAGFQARITELQSQGTLTLAPYSLDIIAHCLILSTIQYKAKNRSGGLENFSHFIAFSGRQMDLICGGQLSS